MINDPSTSLTELHLSQDIAELEKDIALVWEPPDIYDEVMRNNVWLVYGRKGSGKSHLIDYLATEKKRQAKRDVIAIIRSREDQLFKVVMTAINKASSADDRILLEHVAATVEFVIITHLMRKCISLEGFLIPNSEKDKIYSFLRQNKLHDGNILTKTVEVIKRIAGGEFRIVENLASLLEDNPLTSGFTDAKAALWNALKDEHNGFIICIDDIDEIGFSYSNSDRIFVNSLIIVMMRLNIDFSKAKLPLRVLLTMPSELYFHSSLWGDDWMEGKSRCLRWTHPEGIQRIVNKRIARELSIKKSNPRTDNDIYSDSTTSTWDKIFPSTIYNKIGRSEQALTYILRHTFYTPRHTLDICEKIVRHLGEKGYTLSSLGNLAQADWSEIFQHEVEEYTGNIVRSFRKLNSLIYDGLDEVLHAFTGKPIIWTNKALSTYVRDNDLTLTRKESKAQYTGDALIDRLQHLGFLGLGIRDPLMDMRFKMRFSFLERIPTSMPWEIAAISPIFYDTYGMCAVNETIVVPHEKLGMTQIAWQSVLNHVG